MPDLGNDRLYRYRLDASGAFDGDPAVTQLAAGVGPRHVDLHPRLPVAYVINELGNTIDVLTWDTGDATCIQTISTLPADFDGATYTAEIVVASDGCFVYGSNRGLDTMVKGADADARALGFEPASSNDNWEHETLFHGFYRRWRDLMCAPD